MAIVGHSGIQGGNTISSVAWPHNTGTETNSLLLVAVFWGDSYTPVIDVTLNESSIASHFVALARADSEQVAHSVALYAVPGVTGLAELEVLLDGASEMWAASVLVDDADQVSPIRDFVAEGTDDFDVFLEQTVDSAVGDVVLGFLAINGTSDVAQDTIVLADYTSDVKEVSTAPGAAPSVTLTWDGGVNFINGAAITVSIQPPAAGGQEVTGGGTLSASLAGNFTAAGTVLNRRVTFSQANGTELRSATQQLVNVSDASFEWYDKTGNTTGDPDVTGTIDIVDGEAVIPLPGTGLSASQDGTLILYHPSEGWSQTYVLTVE